MSHPDAPRVDLDQQQAIKALMDVSEARWEATEYGNCKLMAKIGDKWLHVCRTDLLDDVCTFGVAFNCKADEAVRIYAQRVRYGARVDGNRFAVVDSVSDG